MRKTRKRAILHRCNNIDWANMPKMTKIPMEQELRLQEGNKVRVKRYGSRYTGICVSNEFEYGSFKSVMVEWEGSMMIEQVTHCRKLRAK